MTATCRVSRPGSSSVIRFTTSAGERPCSSSAIAFGPYCRFADAWVATAPTPGFAYGTAAPDPNARDCTPTPSPLVAGSYAMIENVAYHGSLIGAGTCANAGTAKTATNKHAASDFITPPQSLVNAFACTSSQGRRPG